MRQEVIIYNKNRYLSLIFLKVGNSKQLAIWLWIIHFGAVFLLIYDEIPISIKLLFFGLILYSLNYCWRKYIKLNHPHAVQELMLNSTGEWWLTTNQDGMIAANYEDAFIHPLITIINFKINQDKYQAILCHDAVDKDAFRLLRVRLIHPI